MAELNKTTKTVTKTIEVEEDVFVLTLSQDEAEAVFSLLNRVNSVNQSHTAHIWHKFNDAGVKAVWRLRTQDTNEHVPTIRLEKVL